MNNRVKQKVIKDFWTSYLEHETPFYYHESNKETVSASVEVKNPGLAFFEKVTQQKFMAEYTILLSLYFILIKRYFQDPPNGVMLGLQGSESNNQLNKLFIRFPKIKEKGSSLKKTIGLVKGAVQNIYGYKDFDVTEWKDSNASTAQVSYSDFGFTYSESKEHPKLGAKLQLNITKLFNGHFCIKLNYQERFVPKYLIDHFLKNFQLLWVELEKHLSASPSELSILLPGEETRLLKEFKGPIKQFPSHKTIVDLFEDQVNRTPEAIALIHKGKQLTYQELNVQANQFANYLVQSHQIGKEDLIGLLLPKSDQAVVVILAILKTGAAYLPIDINYPKERIDFIIHDSGIKRLITFDSEATNNRDVPIIPLHQVALEGKKTFKVSINPEDLAYVIYTSGSTGTPKGVMIEHRSNVNMSMDQIELFDIHASDKVVWFASTAFDASVSEIMMALYSGATLVIPTDEVIKNQDQFITFLEEENPTVVTFPPYYLDLLPNKTVDSLRCIITAGEPAHVKKATALAKATNYFNAYGPTECAVCVTTYQVTPQDNARDSIPIGRPIANLAVYILDEHLQMVPPGVVGKIHVAGIGLARGYLNRPELTKAKFIPNPFIAGTNMYDTGDFGYWQPDGNIVFQGRKDDQVKIRGLRIELDEISNVILSLSTSIRQCKVVVTTFNQEKVLAAYLVMDEAVNLTTIRQDMSAQLPEYMVPAFFRTLDQIPLNANGKLDKNALPKISPDDLLKKEFIAPRNTLEAQLVEIWKEILGLEQISTTDNFFDLGGHSLMVAQVINRIQNKVGKTVSIKTFFEAPTILTLAPYLENSTTKPIPKTSLKPLYPLTPSQNRLWTLSHLKGGSIAYNMPAAVSIKGTIDNHLFEKSIKLIIDRHEILRTCFVRGEDGIVQQLIQPQGSSTFSLEVIPKEEISTEEISDFLHKKNSEPFDLEKGPLLRVILLQVQTSSHILFFSVHHLISDGWSQNILFREVLNVYHRLIEGTPINLPTLPIQYKDYAVWLSEGIQEQYFATSERYWMEQFKGEIPVLDLPSYKPRPLIKSFNGNQLTYSFSSEVKELLAHFSKEKETTRFTMLLAGVNVLLSRYTNQDDLIIGIPVAGRGHQELEAQIGLYINTLAIRTKITPEDTYSALLEKQRQTLFTAYEHQYYPLDELVEKLNLKSDPSRSALFDVIVALQDQVDLAKLNQYQVADIEITPYPFLRQTAQVDLSFLFSTADGLEVTIEYNTDIYDEAQINTLAKHLEQVYLSVLRAPDQRVKSIEYISPEERQLVLSSFNKTKTPFPNDQSIIELYKEQVTLTPNQTALIFGDTKLTYRALDIQSTQLASYLLTRYEIKPETPIGVQLERSEWLIISLLAVLKTGAAYVPIDTRYPESRIQFILEDTNCKLVITAGILDQFKSTEVVSKPLPQMTPQSLAYIMYTSGSTGTPKGVMVEHQSVVRLVKSSNFYAFRQQDILLSTGSISFDATTFEYWGPLLNGGCLVLCSFNTLLDHQLLHRVIRQNNVNIMWFTAGWFNQLVELHIDLFDSLKTIVVGGDRLSPLHIQKVRSSFPSLTIINGYGPTENTTFSLTYQIEEVAHDIPIGYPISNSSCYILDQEMQPVPIGIGGELYLGGIGLARGYLNQPDFTREKFIANPFEQGTRLYKTGDWGRWLSDGAVEFWGRKDQQIKIRGYRIELEEIEKVLLEVDYIQQSAVVVQEKDQEKYILAYLVSSIKVNPSNLRTYLLAQVPDYMVPSYFIQLDQLPLTKNGKVDRGHLKNLEVNDLPTEEVYVAPGNRIEEQILDIWEEVLHRKSLSLNGDFFQLGGNSLKAAKLSSLYYTQFKVKIDLKDLFVHTSPAAHAELIQQAKKSEWSKIKPASPAKSYPLSFTQRRFWLLSQVDSVAYNMPLVLQLNQNIDLNLLKKAIEATIERHETLRTIFKPGADGQINQWVVEPGELNFQIDYKEFTTYKKPEQEFHFHIDRMANKAFDLEKGPLLRACLFPTTDRGPILLLNMHHLISDGWSLEVLAHDVFTHYKNFNQKGSHQLSPLKIQFKDFVIWQNAQENSHLFDAHESYWLTQFKDPVPKLTLNISKRRPSIKTYNGGQIVRELEPSRLDLLNRLCRDTKTSLYMNFLSIIGILFYKYSYEKDLVIGSPVSGRIHPDLENQIGCYINTIAIRLKIELKASYKSLLEGVKQLVLDAYEHQVYPFDLLVDKLQLPRDLSRNPLFDVTVTMIQNTQNTKDYLTLHNGQEAFKRLELGATKTKMDLMFHFDMDHESPYSSITYNKDLFEKSDIEDLYDDFMKLLTLIAEDPSLQVENYYQCLLDQKENQEYSSFLEDMNAPLSEEF